MRATLVTDGSLCEFTRTGAWAAWAESERGSFIDGEVLPGSCGGINAVEMRAALLGLQTAIERGVIAHDDHFTLQTDSQHVAGRLRMDYRSTRNRMRARRGLPLPAPGLDNSPRSAFFQTVAARALTFDVILSGAGDRMREVDAFARGCMIRERAMRQGMSIEAAHIAAFEKGLDRARMEWIRSEMVRKKQQENRP